MSVSQLCDVGADGSGLLGQTVVFSMFVGARHGCLCAGSMCPVIGCERECQPSIEYCVPAKWEDFRILWTLWSRGRHVPTLAQLVERRTVVVQAENP